MEAIWVQLSGPRAFACGIPASTRLSVLDRDKAYSSLDACTVHRVPLNGLS
jgi:hypothetical protein